MMKNKRASIPIVILVIGIFAVCVLALFSFSLKILETGKSFGGIPLIEEKKVEYEKIVFYRENLGLSDEEIPELSNALNDEGGTYLYGARENIEVKYYIP